MKRDTSKRTKRIVRHARIRARVAGTASTPRLAVYRSNKHLYAQIIDDASGKTLVSTNDLALKLKGKKSVAADAIGAELAKKAVEKKIKKVVFDRGGFLYAGRIKMLADAARKGGLEF